MTATKYIAIEGCGLCFDKEGKGIKGLPIVVDLKERDKIGQSVLGGPPECPEARRADNEPVRLIVNVTGREVLPDGQRSPIAEVRLACNVSSRVCRRRIV